MSRPRERKVARVLVMLDYGPDDPDSGEVIDVTEIIRETTNATNFSTHIELQIRGWYRSYEAEPLELKVTWSNYNTAAGNSGSSGWLADALNYGLPDNDRVDSLRKKSKCYAKRAEKLFNLAREAKMDQVAAVRALHPVARVTRVSLEDLAKP